MKLAIVVGHDIKAKGATSVGPLNVQEYDYNVDLAEHMYRSAMAKGITTRVFTRNGIGIKGAYENVRKWSDENTVCVELHFNSYNGKVQGSETLFDKDPLESIELAREVHKEIVEVFQRKNKHDRGIKLVDYGERGYLNLNLCKIPSCIVEPFFGDNPADAELGYKLKHQYADAIVDAVFTYFVERDRKMALN
jgi:N-acetylmuramoyl-L-alanine amidase